MIYDCLVIGGGVVGTAIIDGLSKYNLKCILLEKGDDVSVGSSRANSGIVHAGYDCTPGTLMAKFNVRGNKLMWKDVEDLNVPHKKCHSLVVAKDGQMDKLEVLYDKGIKNGVSVKILNREETLKVEPNIADDIVASLYAEDAGIVSPYQLAIAYADRAILNGAEVKVEEEVLNIQKQDNFKVITNKGEYETKLVINAAGANGAKISSIAGAEEYETTYRRGDYYVLDNVENKNISTVLFPLPTEKGKGILVAPTADGNVIYGPTSIIEDEPDTATTLDGFDEIRRNVPLSYSKGAFNKCIRTYAGVRNVIGTDFIIGESKKVANFIQAIGICSPGLTSSPAIAEYMEELVVSKLNATKKDKYIEKLEKKPRLTELSADELNALISKDPKWGQIVCRCEKVTEAEIIQAIHSPLEARTVDAVKRRTRAGMGRCQGGFCQARVMEILSRELNIPLNEIRKGAEGSEIALYPVKEVPND